MKHKIAIACQGGGAHAAFTWGVLREILTTKKRWDETYGDDTFEITALSGTSAGALCALAAWYGLTPNLADPDCGTIDKAIERLDFLWTTFATQSPVEHAHNRFVQDYLEQKEQGAPLPEASPYSRSSEMALTSLAMLGARPQYLGFRGLLEALCPHFAGVNWRSTAETHLRLVVGAVEVLSGNFEVFDSEKTLREHGLASVSGDNGQYEATRWRMQRGLSLAGVAASGTLPEILPAQVIDDLAFPSCDRRDPVRRSGYYWDGLYSQNPPVRELLNIREKEMKPDEIWVIRINPQEFCPENGDIKLNDIRDRVNALSGNISLNQELDHILTVNRWLRHYGDEHPPLNTCKIVELRTIKMKRATARRLRSRSKFDRSLAKFETLREEGHAVARQWLRQWKSLGAAFASYPDDARYAEGSG